jgi:selenide,water dikinase
MRLTSLSHGGGCACKVPAGDLRKVLASLPPITDPDVLVGIATSDDAAVYRLPGGGGQAVVATIDVFTPIVDDPFDYGRIAAANALSDVYAMGGRPLLALSFIGFPTKVLPLEVMGEILRGGAAICAQAGIAIVGGHSIDDPEPKFGLAVVGLVDEARVVRNSTGRPGDALVLTKRIGTGVIAQTVKHDRADAAALAGAVASMTTLNRDACAAMVEVGVSAATDVTGFSLMGHLHEMAQGSGLAARVRAAAVPLLPGAREAVAAGLVPGGSKRNAEHFGRWVEVAPSFALTLALTVDDGLRALLFDAQTSGGLLIAVAAERLEALRAALRARGVLDAVIGELVAGPAGSITIE